MRFPIISNGQESERLLEALPEAAVIGWVGDYDIDTRNALESISLSSINNMPVINGKKAIYFSVMTMRLESPEFTDMKSAMHNDCICSMVYDLAERFPSFLRIEHNRLYYTRQPIGKTYFKTSELFPISKDGDAPDTIIERGDLGFVIACDKPRKVAELEKTYNKYPSESEYEYIQHADFILYFDFNNIADFKNALADKQWSGALLTILNWGMSEQEVMQRDWKKSAEWLREYAPYHCPRAEMWLTEEMMKRGERELYVRMPKTSEWKARKYAKREKQVYISGGNNDDFDYCDTDDTKPSTKHNNTSQTQIDYNTYKFYYTDTYNIAYNDINIKARNNNKNNNVDDYIPDIVTEDSLPSP